VQTGKFPQLPQVASGYAGQGSLELPSSSGSLALGEGSAESRTLELSLKKKKKGMKREIGGLDRRARRNESRETDQKE